MKIKFIINLIIALNFSSSASLTASYALSPDVFGLEVGNTFKYQGTDQAGAYTSEQEVISIDQTTFPTITYIVEEQGDGETDRGWYQKTPGTLKLWGIQDVVTGEYFKFSAGLIEAWYPMQVGDNRYSYATAEYNFEPDIIVNTSLTVDVLAKEPVILGFDTLEAFKVRYQLRFWFDGYYDETDKSYSWVVPYLGGVKYQDDTSQEILTNFAIAGGSITETTDFDGDGLKDYQELIIYDTNWEDADTDHDGFSDGDEIKAGTDPNDPNSHPLRAMPWIPLLLLDD